MPPSAWCRMARICGSLNLLVFIKISSFIKPEKILLLKPVICRGITVTTGYSAGRQPSHSAGRQPSHSAAGALLRAPGTRLLSARLWQVPLYEVEQPFRAHKYRSSYVGLRHMSKHNNTHSLIFCRWVLRHRGRYGFVEKLTGLFRIISRKQPPVICRRFAHCEPSSTRLCS